jgi:amino acid transporter
MKTDLFTMTTDQYYYLEFRRASRAALSCLTASNICAITGIALGLYGHVFPAVIAAILACLFALFTAQNYTQSSRLFKMAQKRIK